MSEAQAQALQEYEQALEPLAGRHVTLVVTGSISAAFLPYWLNFVGGLPARPELRVLLTRTASTMVSPRAVSALLGRPAEIDAWDDPDSGEATHVELAEWSDAFLVYPCTFSYLGRLGAGLADTPAQLALQCSRVPAVVCPALPPGTLDSPAYHRHVAGLAERGAVTVLPPILGISAATGRREGLPPTHFPIALAAVAAALGAETEQGDG